MLSHEKGGANMEETPQNTQHEIVATKVYQWLSEWEKVAYDDKHHRRKPDPCFYLFAMSASGLKALTGISRRTVVSSIPVARSVNIIFPNLHFVNPSV